MQRISCLAALAAIFLCTAAAAAPTLSGKYVFTEHRVCQPNLNFNMQQADQTGHFVRNVLYTGANFKNRILLLTFNPTKGTVSGAGFEDSGDPLIVTLTGVEGGQQGNNLAETAAGGKTTFTNTDTTFNFDNVAYNAMYAQIDKNNIAHYFAIQAVFTNDNGRLCSSQGQLMRQ